VPRREVEVTSNSGVRAEDQGADPTLVLPGSSLTEVATGRQFVREQIDGRLPHRIADQIQLATSELVTNALVHGERGPIVMTVHVNTDTAWVRIASDADPSVQLPPVWDWSISPSSRLSGRGLGIVKAVSDWVDVERLGRQLAITACFDVNVSRPAS
jgi:anti-sigma regulatory factor (Ser/Thr protein kinase)